MFIKNKGRKWRNSIWTRVLERRHVNRAVSLNLNSQFCENAFKTKYVFLIVWFWAIYANWNKTIHTYIACVAYKLPAYIMYIALYRQEKFYPHCRKAELWKSFDARIWTKFRFENNVLRFLWRRSIENSIRILNFVINVLLILSSKCYWVQIDSRQWFLDWKYSDWAHSKTYYTNDLAKISMLGLNCYLFSAHYC